MVSTGKRLNGIANAHLYLEHGHLSVSGTAQQLKQKMRRRLRWAAFPDIFTHKHA
jgi:hypothetical protein